MPTVARTERGASDRTAAMSDSLHVPKTAVIGATGFLGSHFLRACRAAHPDCVGTDRTGTRPDLHALDLMEPDLAPLRLRETGHEHALILAAVSRVERCEREPEASRRVNVDGSLALVRQLVASGIRPVFFSSDYVFDGERGGYEDDAPVCPGTEYGRQKAEVEAGIGGISGGAHLVVRLSKVFSVCRGDGSLLDEMACRFFSGKPYRAAFDQAFSPTLASDVVGAVSALIAGKAVGTVNVCSPERWTRYELARALAAAMGADPDLVRRASLDDISAPFRRPKDTSLVARRLAGFGAFTPMSRCIEAVAAAWRER
jgi:dTDP-4-dehydrorhamnose reductase